MMNINVNVQHTLKLAAQLENRQHAIIHPTVAARSVTHRMMPTTVKAHCNSRFLVDQCSRSTQRCTRDQPDVLCQALKTHSVKSQTESFIVGINAIIDNIVIAIIAKKRIDVSFIVRFQQLFASRQWRIDADAESGNAVGVKQRSEQFRSISMHRQSLRQRSQLIRDNPRDTLTHQCRASMTRAPRSATRIS